MTYIPNTSSTQGSNVVGATAATAGDYFWADPSGGDFTITLPANPGANDSVNVKHVGASGIVTVSGNGKNIDGAATAAIDRQWESFQVIYNLALDAWFII